ncbi:MAG: hypothetical protein HY890_00270 [Deltaproteobacteria bacterium]|nr:hypothetical protein [Deltaproteobacteria bacterium]
MTVEDGWLAVRDGWLAVKACLHGMWCRAERLKKGGNKPLDFTPGV